MILNEFDNMHVTFTANNLTKNSSGQYASVSFHILCLIKHVEYSVVLFYYLLYLHDCVPPIVLYNNYFIDIRLHIFSYI